MKRHWLKRLALVGFLGLLGLSIVLADLPAPYVPSKGAETITPAKPWKYVLIASGSVTASSATTDLTATDLSWGTFVQSAAHITATNGLIDVWGELGYVNAVTLAFFTVDDAANDNFDIDLYAWAGMDLNSSLYGPAIPVYLTTGDACIVGTYDCVKLPSLGTAQANGLWVDTISGTDDCWPSGVTVSDSGNNRMATITFDLMGCRYLYIRLWNDSTGGTEAANIGCIMKGY